MRNAFCPVCDGLGLGQGHVMDEQGLTSDAFFGQKCMEFRPTDCDEREKKSAKSTRTRSGRACG